jgi:hypothetical protein
MPAANLPLGIFQGGQMTDLPPFPFTVDLTALIEIVSPGNEIAGVNYAATALQLGQLIGGVIYSQPTFVLAGSVYNSIITDTRILVNKTIGSATSIVLAPSAGYQLPVLVKDLKLDAATNPITVTFSGGQTLDGLSQIVINNTGGYFWFNPLASGGWYDAAN